MKKISKKLLCLIMTTALLVTALPATLVSAAEKPSFAKTISLSTVETSGYVVGNISSTAKITNLKSSKKSVVAVRKEYYKETKQHIIWFEPKKPGTSTVSFKVKQGSKTTTIKCKVKVHKYSNPISSLKIGSKNVKSSFNDKTYTTLKYSKYKNKSMKVSLKLKDGWKVYNNKFNYYNGKTLKEIKFGKKVKITKKNSSISFSAYNTKTGLTQSYSVMFS